MCLYMDIRDAYDNAEDWSKSQKPPFNLNFFVMRPKLKAEPKGVVLIIGAFNLPLFLTLSPLVRRNNATLQSVVR